MDKDNIFHTIKKNSHTEMEGANKHSFKDDLKFIFYIQSMYWLHSCRSIHVHVYNNRSNMACMCNIFCSYNHLTTNWTAHWYLMVYIYYTYTHTSLFQFQYLLISNWFLSRKQKSSQKVFINQQCILLHYHYMYMCCTCMWCILILY